MGLGLRGPATVIAPHLWFCFGVVVGISSKGKTVARSYFVRMEDATATTADVVVGRCFVIRAITSVRSGPGRLLL